MNRKAANRNLRKQQKRLEYRAFRKMEEQGVPIQGSSEGSSEGDTAKVIAFRRREATQVALYNPNGALVGFYSVKDGAFLTPQRSPSAPKVVSTQATFSHTGRPSNAHIERVKAAVAQGLIPEDSNVALEYLGVDDAEDESAELDATGEEVDDNGETQREGETLP